MMKRGMLRLAIIAACGPVLMVGALIALVPIWRKRRYGEWLRQLHELLGILEKIARHFERALEGESHVASAHISVARRDRRQNPLLAREQR